MQGHLLENWRWIAGVCEVYVSFVLTMDRTLVYFGQQSLLWWCHASWCSSESGREWGRDKNVSWAYCLSFHPFFHCLHRLCKNDIRMKDIATSVSYYDDDYHRESRESFPFSSWVFSCLPVHSLPYFLSRKRLYLPYLSCPKYRHSVLSMQDPS